MRINIHAGHNPDGKTACGAVGLIKESTEARAVVSRVIRRLRAAGHTVYDCTINDGKSATDVLKRIVEKCNSHEVDLDISVHFNSAANDLRGNGITTGTEVYVYTTDNGKSPAYQYGRRIVEAISALGFRNRGIKTNKDFYVLRATKAPAMIVECCFVDDKDDCELYSAASMADAIAGAITGIDYTNSLEEDREMIYNYVDENMPEWARKTVQKLVDKGYLKGDESGKLGLNDTMLKVFVVNDRAGLYGE